MFYTTLQTNLGPWYICQQGQAIVRLSIGETPPFAAEKQDTDLLKQARRQITEYLAGMRTSFNLPLEPAGTPFQKAVWEALLRIPYGETVCYGDLAQMVGRPKGARAVGGACHQNPIPLIIPCHRVVGKDGSLTGFGLGLDMKIALLNLEQGKMDLFQFLASTS